MEPSKEFLDQEQTNGEQDEWPAHPKRRKHAEPQKWKKNIRKLRRAAGESYTNTRGVVIPAKVLDEYYQCSCRNGCTKKISYDQRLLNYRQFYQNASWETQTAFIAKSVLVSKIKRRRISDPDQWRKKERRYYFLQAGSFDVPVCKPMYMNTLCIDSARIHRALQKAKAGSFVDQRGKHPAHNATPEDTINEIKMHIESFPSYASHYRRSDTPDCRYLPSGLNLAKMHALYIQSIGPGKHLQVSLQTYKRIFHRFFNLKFQTPKKDTCKTCDQLKIQIDSEEAKSVAERDPETINKLKSALDDHHKLVDLAKNIRASDSEMARQKECHVICFDLQKTFPLPKLTTGEAYYKRQLTVFNFGIHDFSTQQGYMYTWHEGIASRGAQEVIELYFSIRIFLNIV